MSQQPPSRCRARMLVAGLLSMALLPAQRRAEEALPLLQAGNQRFVAGKSLLQPLGCGVRRSLARSDSPFAIVLCCADSRVPPEHVFNCGLGELYVVRVAGNSCDAESLASIEYAAQQLGVQLCVVLGHEGCGAIADGIEAARPRPVGQAPPSTSPALATLLEHAEPAVRKALAAGLDGKELADRAEEEHAQDTAAECLRRSPPLAQLRQL
ncbi:MAG TPA: carbonic anhydrase, partial [Planctomycetota bacterium]|nr:carbonic anhydrase [Planctomycetota bacterium]